jgi:D-xylose transport system substrate-binding protein
MDDSDYGRWVKDKELFIRQIEKSGGEVIFRASEGDTEKQLEQAKEILNEKVKILVIVPSDLNYAAKIVKLAHQYNVKVISYDRLIKNCNLDFYISFNNGKCQVPAILLPSRVVNREPINLMVIAVDYLISQRNKHEINTK